MSGKCLILGGAGFIGSNIAQTLVANGYSVKIFDLSADRFDTDLLRQVEFIRGDFFNFREWKGVLRDVDYVFHNICTTIPSISDKNPVFDIETNVVGNIRFLQELRGGTTKKIVFSSSGGTIYGQPNVEPIRETHPTNPITSYGISKLTVEKYLFYFRYHYGLDFVSLRYSNVYGIGQDPHGILGAVTIFLGCLKDGKPITVFGDGSIVRDYLYIDDVSRANLYAIKKKTKSKIFNVGTGVGTSTKELLRLISEVTGKRVEVNYLEKRSSDVDTNVLDSSLIKEELGWEASVNLREGIGRLWADMQNSE